jgi:hypothetical protein
MEELGLVGVTNERRRVAASCTAVSTVRRHGQPRQSGSVFDGEGDYD